VSEIDNTEWEPEKDEEYVPVPTDLSPITDEYLRGSMQRAMLWVAIMGFAGASVLLLLAGWQTALLLLIGAAISAAGLWDWQRMVGLLTAKLDNVETRGGARVIVLFLLRLLVAGGVLYGSLKSLHGSVYALLGGLAFAAIAMAIEATRLMRSSQV
jgi:hypothetical protein